MSEKKYWWKDKPKIGTYDFCYNEAGDYSFYIDEVAVRYKHSCAEEERQQRFGGTKFIFGGCAGGVGYSDYLLKAETIEDAKKEFEVWYEQYLVGRVESLKEALAAATGDYEQFLLYKGDS